MNQYILIAEFADKKKGFIIGTFSEEKEAKALVDDVYDELDSLNSLLEIPPRYCKKSQSYKITKAEYFPTCDKYGDRFCRSNGDLSVFVIRCTAEFDAKAFIEYRNFFNVYGVMMN